MPTECCWVIHGSLTSERKASTSPSSFINHSTLLLNRAFKRQAPCLYNMHFEVRALDRLRVRTRRRVGSTRRRGNHMHDHSRFQRDIIHVTGVSLSLYLAQKSLTHNIGSASALPIIQVESKYKEIRHATLETGGRESAKKVGWGGGGLGKLDSTSSLRLDKDPRWAQEVREVRLYRPISSQTCCTVATAPGAALVGRKQLSSADWMAFWLTSVVHRECFLPNGVFVQRFQAPSGQAFFLEECKLWEKIFAAFLG